MQEISQDLVILVKASQQMSPLQLQQYYLATAMDVSRLTVSVLLAAFISVRSFRKGSLTAAGAAGAFGMGVVRLTAWSSCVGRMTCAQY